MRTKADGVGEQQRLLVRQRDLSRGGIERGEKLVLDENVGAGEPAQERRLADIGVADDRCVRHRCALAVFPLGGASATHRFQFALEPVDLQSDFPLVLLELAFAFAFRANSAALLSEVTPRARQSRQRIFHARQVHLDAGFARLRARAENIENDFVPIRDGHPGELLPVALLRRTQLVVEDEHIALELFCEVDDLLRLARTDQIARVLFAMMHQHPLDHRNAERVDELFQLLEQTLRVSFLAGSMYAPMRSARSVIFSFGLISNMQDQHSRLMANLALLLARSPPEAHSSSSRTTCISSANSPLKSCT